MLRVLSLFERSRSVVGAVLAVAAAAALPGCNGFHEVCEKATLTAEPGRVVQFEGEPHLEVTARFMNGDKPVVGANLRFEFALDRGGFSMVDIDTDATGVATLRQSFDDMALDVRGFGVFQDPWVARWNDQFPVDDVAYCEARATGSLPLDQLPQPILSREPERPVPIP